MWWQFYDALPTDFDNDPFIREIQQYADLSEVHELKQPQLKTMRTSFTKSNVGKKWLGMIDFVDNNFPRIKQQRIDLLNANLI